MRTFGLDQEIVSLTRIAHKGCVLSGYCRRNACRSRNTNFTGIQHRDNAAIRKS